MTRALLLGKEPGLELGFQYVQEEPYDAVVIGSLSLSQLLRFREETVLQALAEGKPVYLYPPGLPEAPKNRALSGSLTAAQRDLKNWGILFTDGWFARTNSPIITTGNELKGEAIAAFSKQLDVKAVFEYCMLP